MTKAFTPKPEGPAQICHVANLRCPGVAPDDDLAVLDHCYIETRNVLDFALRHKSRILIVSTADIGSEHRFRNTEGMRLAEAVAYACREQYGTDVRIAHVSDAHSPGLPVAGGHPVSIFIDRATKGEDSRLAGDGTAIRYLEYIMDCVAGLWTLMNATGQY
jgi:UDP-glucuronate decarboxylase